MTRRATENLNLRFPVLISRSQVEHNPLVNNGHLAWAVEYDLTTNTVRALNPQSNSWCAAGQSPFLCRAVLDSG
jgi:hypothetical protein